MSKLFTESERITSNITLEQYKNYFAKTEIISNESFIDFTSQVKDLLATAFNKATFVYNDKAVQDIMSLKFQTQTKVKNLDFTTTSENITSKPESFKGKYINYLTSIQTVAKVLNKDIFKVLEEFKIVIAMFINDANNEQIGTLPGIATFKRYEKDLEEFKKAISHYSPINTGKSKGTFRELLQTYEDIPKLFNGIAELDKVINYLDVKSVDKEVENIKELIDTLIDLGTNDKVHLSNEEHKKGLVYITYVAGKYVEFYSYLYTNMSVFYTVFKNNCEDLNKL